MNVSNDKSTQETGRYDDAVLEAEGLPPVDLPLIAGDEDPPTATTDTKVEADAFLEAYYRNQE